MIEHDILERIDSLRKRRHWSLYRLAKEANIPYSNLSNIFNRQTCPSVPTLEKICNGFGISLSEFFEFQTLPKTNDELTEQEEEIIYALRSLSKKDRELFQTYLKGLCHKKM